MHWTTADNNFMFDCKSCRQSLCPEKLINTESISNWQKMLPSITSNINTQRLLKRDNNHFEDTRNHLVVNKRSPTNESVLFMDLIGHHNHKTINNTCRKLHDNGCLQDESQIDLRHNATNIATSGSDVSMKSSQTHANFRRNFNSKCAIHGDLREESNKFYHRKSDGVDEHHYHNNSDDNDNHIQFRGQTREFAKQYDHNILQQTRHENKNLNSDCSNESRNCNRNHQNYNEDDDINQTQIKRHVPSELRQQQQQHKHSQDSSRCDRHRAVTQQASNNRDVITRKHYENVARSANNRQQQSYNSLAQAKLQQPMIKPNKQTMTTTKIADQVNYLHKKDATNLNLYRMLMDHESSNGINIDKSRNDENSEDETDNYVDVNRMRNNLNAKNENSIRNPTMIKFISQIYFLIHLAMIISLLLHHKMLITQNQQHFTSYNGDYILDTWNTISPSTIPTNNLSDNIDLRYKRTATTITTNNETTVPPETTSIIIENNAAAAHSSDILVRLFGYSHARRFLYYILAYLLATSAIILLSIRILRYINNYNYKSSTSLTSQQSRRIWRQRNVEMSYPNLSEYNSSSSSTSNFYHRIRLG